MTKKIKITDLLNTTNFNKYKNDLVNYFDRGGTWHNLLGYESELMETQYRKAYKLYHKGDYKSASSAFSYLTMLNPYEYHYWMGLGISKQKERLFEEAIVSYTAAEALNPEHPLPHLHLAQCFYAINVPDQTVDHLKKTIEIAAEQEAYQEIRQKAEVILKHLPT